MLKLFCKRPHVSVVDFKTSRFVVAKISGINVRGVHLTLGDEIPPGALSPEALRQEYERPGRYIETLDYAKTDPDLREACARRGVVLKEAAPEPPKPEPATVPNLDELDHRELVRLCEERGLPTSGNRKQLRQRLSPVVE